MAYHLSVVKIIHEINQQDTPPSPKPHTPEMSITPGPGVSDFQFSLKRGEGSIFFKGTELVLQLSFNGYRVALLDTNHYGCAVHIATFSVSETEMKKIQEALGGEIEECMLDLGELIDNIIMPERRQLLGPNG